MMILTIIDDIYNYATEIVDFIKDLSTIVLDVFSFLPTEFIALLGVAIVLGIFGFIWRIFYV